MSEHQPVHHERLPSQPEHQEAAPRRREREHTAAETKSISVEEIDKLRSSIEQHARSSSETASRSTEQDAAPSPRLINRELKQLAYQRTLTRARKSLNPADRAVSKVVHLPGVEELSELGSQTVARPSGAFGGGLVALIGTGVLLWVSKHYGYRYNYLFFIFLFIGGFGLGLLAELGIRLIAKRRG